MYKLAIVERIMQTDRVVMKPFQAFLWQRYYANRDEYFAFGQTQPYDFRTYVKLNIQDCKREYRTLRHKYNNEEIL